MSASMDMLRLGQKFPNLNPSTIQDVLNAKGGDVQATYDTLMAISTPQPQPPYPPRRPLHDTSGSGVALPAYPSGRPAPYEAAYQQQHVPNSYQVTASKVSPLPSPLPEMGNLSLSEKIMSNPATNTSTSMSTSKQGLQPRTQHWASCDGCGADPIRGIRWHCLKCPDEDLCNNCKEAGVQNAHRFERVEVGVERHDNVYCDGCNIPERPITGVRYSCKTHVDEDFCQRCVSEGRACAGPFDQIRATPLAKYLEQWGAIPMPQEWLPLLQPESGRALYIGHCNGANSWRDLPTTLSFTDTPQKAWVNHTPPSFLYTTDFVTKKGHFHADHNISWTLSLPGTKNKIWTFSGQIDRKTNEPKSATLSHVATRGSLIPLTWQRYPTGDAMSFQTPDGVRYRWVTSSPTSNLHGHRQDLNRFALFASSSSSHTNPHARETIIADFAFNDGCPIKSAERLTLRDPKIDEPFVLASLLSLITFSNCVQNAEYLRDPRGVQATEDLARLTPLGREAFWYASEFGGDGGDGGGGTSSAQKLRYFNTGVKGATAALKITEAIMNASAGAAGGG